VVSLLRRYDIRIHVFVVIGIPGELDSHREETLSFLARLEIDWAYIFIAIPIVGSRLYELCKDKGYLIDDSYGHHVASRGSIQAPGIDPAEIEEYAYYMNTMVNFVENANVKKGKYDLAEEYFLNVVRSYPEQAMAHYMLSVVYKDRDPEQARRHYLSYLENFEKHIGPYRKSRFWANIFSDYPWAFCCIPSYIYGKGPKLMNLSG
jgi:tetratricopeptide (TPR) repeat protein